MNRRRNIMAAAGTLVLLLFGNYFGWSLFRVSVSEVFSDWGAAALSMNFSLFIVVFCFGSLFAGRACDKLGRQKLLAGACLLIALGVFGFGFVMPRLTGSAALATLYISYGGFCGCGIGIGYNVVISGVSKWFPDRPGFISGLLLTGYGLGSLVCGAVISALSGIMGFWNAFMAFGAVIVVVAFACSFLFKVEAGDGKAPDLSFRQSEATRNLDDGGGCDNPGGILSNGLPFDQCLALPNTTHTASALVRNDSGKDGDVARRVVAPYGDGDGDARDYPTGKMLKTGKFWLLFGWALLTGCVGLMVINSAAVIAITFGVAATLGLVVSLFNGFGRIAAGVVYDKLGQVSTFAVEAVAFLSGALMVAAHATGSQALMFGGMLCAGLSYGAAMAVIAAVIRDVFGTKYYASNFAVVTMAGIPSSFLGPFVSGLLQDAAGGDYLTTYFAMLVFAVLGLLCALGAKRLKIK